MPIGHVMACCGVDVAIQEVTPTRATPGVTMNSEKTVLEQDHFSTARRPTGTPTRTQRQALPCRPYRRRIKMNPQRGSEVSDVWRHPLSGWRDLDPRPLDPGVPVARVGQRRTVRCQALCSRRVRRVSPNPPSIGLYGNARRTLPYARILCLTYFSLTCGFVVGLAGFEPTTS